MSVSAYNIKQHSFHCITVQTQVHKLPVQFICHWCFKHWHVSALLFSKIGSSHENRESHFWISERRLQKTQFSVASNTLVKGQNVVKKQKKIHLYAQGVKKFRITLWKTLKKEIQIKSGTFKESIHSRTVTLRQGERTQMQNDWCKDRFYFTDL